MKNLLLSILLLFTIPMFNSCSDDDVMSSESCSDGIQNGNEVGVDCGGDCPSCDTTVEEDKTNVNQTLDDLVGCVEELRDGRSFTEVFDNFLNLSEGDAMNEEWVENILDELELVFDFERIDETSRFDLAYHAGTHTYNNATGTWLKSADVTDELILNFPSSPTSNSNNVVFGIDSYVDEVVSIDGETLSLPKSLHAYLNIDNTKAMELTLSNITYAENTGYQIPVEISASLFLDPMTLNFDVSRLSNTSYDMKMSFDNDKLCDVEIASQFELTDDDFENLDENSIDKAAVQVNLGQMSFRTMGDLASLLALDDPTESQVNSLIDLDLFYRNIKIGDLEINDDMETILIFYKDETSENMDSFLDRMENILEDLFG